MIAWWRARSPREQFLLGIAGLFLAAALLWQFVLHPALKTLDQAKRDHERATQTLTRLDRIDSRIQLGDIILPQARSAAAQDIDTLRQEAERLAGESGLPVETSETLSPTVFAITVSGTSGPAYFQWIEQVEAGLGLSVTSAALAQNADGEMDADTEFSLDSR